MSSSSLALFDNIAQEDPLGFYQDGSAQYERPVEFLHLRKDEIAAATELPKKSIRYDGKIPPVLKERLHEWAQLINLVAGHFNDPDKTMTWFQTPNPLLGNISPKQMIVLGRFNKLFEFIKTALDENRR